MSTEKIILAGAAITVGILLLIKLSQIYTETKSLSKSTEGLTNKVSEYGSSPLGQLVLSLGKSIDP